MFKIGCRWTSVGILPKLCIHQEIYSPDQSFESPRVSSTWTAIPPLRPWSRSLLNILYPRREISPSVISSLSQVSVKAIICRLGDWEIRIFNLASFPRGLRIFSWTNISPRNFVASAKSTEMLKQVSVPSSLFYKNDLCANVHGAFLAGIKISAQTF